VTLVKVVKFAVTLKDSVVMDVVMLAPMLAVAMTAALMVQLT
jgi:hypothetical protein